MARSESIKSFKAFNWFDIKGRGRIVIVELGSAEPVSSGEIVKVDGDLYLVRSVEHYPIAGTSAKRTQGRFVLDGKKGLTVEKV